MTALFYPQLTAQRFWERAGAEEPFPRQLMTTVLGVLQVADVPLPGLTVAKAADWLARRGADCIGNVPDRQLCGFLVAQRGHAFIFIDSSLSAAEQRLTFAHETAHFLYHYEAPRLAAIEMLGETIKPVLDGDRAATPHERLRGALRDVPLGVYKHMLDRSDGVPDATTSRLEAEADLIAFELLAPMDVVLRTTQAGDCCRTALEKRFGLPAWAAARWGAWVDAQRDGDSFLSRLQAAREAAEL